MPDIERAEASDLNALPCFQRINHAVKESAAIRSKVTFIEWMGDLSALCRDDRDGGGMTECGVEIYGKGRALLLLMGTADGAVWVLGYRDFSYFSG